LNPENLFDSANLLGNLIVRIQNGIENSPVPLNKEQKNFLKNNTFVSRLNSLICDGLKK
jgi:hypothetical protein